MSHRLLVGTRKGLFILERSSGKTWRKCATHFLGDPIEMLLDDPRDGSLYVTLAHEQFGLKMHASRDGGETWQEIATPEYPPQPEGVEDVDGMGRPVQWKLQRIWSLETGSDSQSGLLWCGTLPGGLFRSTDGGASWELIRPLWDDPARKQWFGGGADFPGINSISVDPRDQDTIRVAVSCGGVWLTTDAGQSWSNQAVGWRAEYMPPDRSADPNIQDAHRMVQCKAEPDKLWVQHHNGIFRTTDGGTSWHEILQAGPSTFGFAAVVHPVHGDTAWFVPGVKDECRVPVDSQLVVTRTRDGGQSFETLGNGLPAADAYDIVYRHAMDIDPEGDALAMGSTTGNFWTSDDQGDHWQAVSSNLPPVYCVRFVR